MAGHPVLEIELPDTLALGAEFYRWEFATAVAGASLGINPFDEPNVTEAKEATARASRATGRNGSLPDPGRSSLRPDGTSGWAAGPPVLGQRRAITSRWRRSSGRPRRGTGC